MPTLILEAALRSLLMALAVWAGIRLLRLHHVLAQKVAWVLVLAAAVIMPLVMKTPFLGRLAAISISMRSLPFARSAAPTSSSQAANPAESHIVTMISSPAQTQRPQIRHLASRSQITIARPHPSIARSQPAAQITEFSTTPSAPAQPPAQPAWTRISSALAWAYLAIAAALLLRTAIGLIIAARLWHRAEPVIGVLGVQPAFQQDIRVRVSPDLNTPVTIARTILLPADYEQWGQYKLNVVLAHEQSHVRQRDFYLQLIAATHAAIFWFSPLGWWLQRKLSELGEALSDRAGLEQAVSPASYAQILLEFAARPRPTLAGVAMARHNNLSSRIDRILNHRHLDFLGGRRPAILAAILVPATLVAAVVLIRVVPAVEAASSPTKTAHLLAQTSAQTTAGTKATATLSATPTATLTVNQAESVTDSQSNLTRATAMLVLAQGASTTNNDQITTVEYGQSGVPTPPTPPTPPAAETPEPPEADIQEPTPPEPPAAIAPMAPRAPRAPKAPHSAYHYSYSGDNDGDSFAIVHGDNKQTVYFNGDHHDQLDEARQKYHGNFIWFEHDGKSYVIDDPAFVAQADEMFKGSPELEKKQAELDRQQKVLNGKMEALNPEMARINLNSPEFKDRMAKLQAQLSVLQAENFKKLSAELTAEKLGDLQEKIGDIQGQIGELQGEIGEKQGEIGEKQGEIGEQMGRLGEEMGRIGEEQGRIAEEASHKLASQLDQAIKSGKAKPVE